MSNGGASGIARPQQSLLPAQTGQQRGFGQPMMGKRTAGQMQPAMGRITGNDKQVNSSLFSDPQLGQMRQPMGFATNAAMPGDGRSVMGGRQREMQKNNPPPNYFPNGGEPVTNMPMPQQPPQQSNNYQANVDFMNQMAQKNAQVGSDGSPVAPSFSYNAETGQYMQDSSAFGLTGDAANTYFSPEEFQSKFGKTLGKMPSQGGGDDLASDMRYRGGPTQEQKDALIANRRKLGLPDDFDPFNNPDHRNIPNPAHGGKSLNDQMIPHPMTQIPGFPGGDFTTTYNPNLYSDPNLGQTQGGGDQGPIGTGVPASDVPAFDPSYNSGVAGGMQKYGGSYSDPNLGQPRGNTGTGGTSQQTGTGQQRPNINSAAADAIYDSLEGARKEMAFKPDTITADQAAFNRNFSQGYQARGADTRGYDAFSNSAQGYNAANADQRGYTAAGTDSEGYNAERAGSQGFTGAQANAEGYRADNAGSTGYNATNTGSDGYAAQLTGAQGFTAAGVDSTGYGAERAGPSREVGANNVQSGLLADTDLSRYINQYDDAVVDNTLSDLDRARVIQQQNIGANATAAGAFGGSRHALREAENNKNFYDQAAKTAASLRQTGFNNAQQMGLSDIQNTMRGDLANQGANLQADSLSANLAQQTALANQNAGNTANQFGAQAANQAALAASAQQQQANQFGAQAANQARNLNQAAQNQAMQFGAGASNAARLANASAANQASQFGANASNNAALANMSANNQAAQFGASANNAAALANQASTNQGNQFTSAAANQAALANQNAANQANQFGAQAGNTAALANQAALNQAGQFGASAYNTAGLANQAAQNQAGQFGANAANNSSLANQNAFNQAAQFGAQAFNTGSLADQAAVNNARQFSANAMNNSSLANQSQANNMGQFNAQQRMAAQMANQNGQLAGSQQRLNAGNQLANLGNLGFGMGQTLNRNMAQDGAMRQGLNQLLIDAARNQFNNYRNQPYSDVGLISAALGQSPVPQTTTTSKTPGLFDYLSLGASAMSSDMRLKTNINQVGDLPNGLGIYTWDWTDEAVEKGLANNMHIGVLAQEVEKIMPSAVVHTDSGYMAVKYNEILQEL